MKKAWFVKIFILICAFSAAISAQNTNQPKIESQEIDESDGIPVLIKHLPDWENIRNRATYILNGNDLRKALGERPIFDLIDFTGEAEAVTAPYDAGKLLIVEYNSPETSIETDTKIKQSLSENANNPPIFYRRIGNYNAFVFDGNNEMAANALLDQIKYEKMVQWLGKDPYAQQRAERVYLLAAGELIFTTVMMIVGGFGSAVLAGIVLGIAFYYIREQKRNQTQIFTDAGGMTRLNLDGLTADSPTDKFLKD